MSAKKYDGRIERAVDGDTLIIMINLGFDVYKSERIRLNGIDVWEMNDPDEMKRNVAKKAKQVAKDQEQKECIVTTYKRDIYGRMICDVSIDGKDFSTTLLDLGLANPIAKYQES